MRHHFRYLHFKAFSNSIKNTSRRGVLTFVIEPWSCGSPGGLQVPTFGSVSLIFTLASKWGCDNQFDSRPLKVRNCPDFLAYRCHVAYLWKVFNKGYKSSLDFISNRGMHTKLWASKVSGVPIFENLSRLLKQNDIWVQAPWLSIENTIRGKLEASFKSRSWSVCVCPWLVYAPKMLQLCITNLFSLCRFVWIIDLLVTCPNPHPKAPTRFFTLEMLRTKEHNPTPYLLIVFTFEFKVESIRELGGVSWKNIIKIIFYFDLHHDPTRV
jgi:hypothetical protein